ncbi:MAG TPA: Fe-S cluster assembly ATPase SufC [Chlamydiales bacterium]|nr:Fe-S cluster assembly ATPase SufC [Chlamydiales bacterium]
MIEIIDIHVEVAGKPILNGLHLHIEKGEVHAVMGPNGSGKSTLARVLAGHPAYQVTKGEIWFKKQNLLEMAPEERACAGMFMSFQYPLEIAGVSNRQFLASALNIQRKAKGLEPLASPEFEELLQRKMDEMEIKAEFSERNVNEGFSGGEKKRNEILQMSLFDPDLAILDETDSGLDIDAMRIVAKGVNQMLRKDNALLLITHYQRLLDFIRPDFVHVLADGRIIRTGKAELALELEEKGYAPCSA